VHGVIAENAESVASKSKITLCASQHLNQGNYSSMKLYLQCRNVAPSSAEIAEAAAAILLARPLASLTHAIEKEARVNGEAAARRISAASAALLPRRSRGACLKSQMEALLSEARS